jgi:hypothetical protein
LIKNSLAAFLFGYSNTTIMYSRFVASQRKVDNENNSRLYTRYKKATGELKHIKKGKFAVGHAKCLFFAGGHSVSRFLPEDTVVLENLARGHRAPFAAGFGDRNFCFGHGAPEPGLGWVPTAPVHAQTTAGLWHVKS